MSETLPNSSDKPPDTSAAVHSLLERDSVISRSPEHTARMIGKGALLVNTNTEERPYEERRRDYDALIELIMSA
ncbi:MAG TPA: hypothetical protein VFL85_03980 [Candidatus Saccharimonadales bacterium]|nr:hypothetical protein [Candidatus Saccharimonadales bacterium]